MKKSNFALRLQRSLMEEAKKVAKAEGVAVNQLINVAVAEKVSALRTEEYLLNGPPRATSRRRFECSSVRARETRRFLVTNCPRRQRVVVGERLNMIAQCAGRCATFSLLPGPLSSK